MSALSCEVFFWFRSSCRNSFHMCGSSTSEFLAVLISLYYTSRKKSLEQIFGSVLVFVMESPELKKLKPFWDEAGIQNRSKWLSNSLEGK